MPKRALFEENALTYPLGKQIYDTLSELNVTIGFVGSHNRVTGIPGKTVQEAYAEAKQTLVVGVRKSLDFATCKPSAHYQLPLTTSCPGMCEYCYLATTLGKKPYLRLYVNIDDILLQAEKLMAARMPELTLFEGAATSDPIPTEYLSGLLFHVIEFFGRHPSGRFRFVTKFTDVDSLLTVKHQGHTRFRFSLNAQSVIKRYEHKTPDMEQRIRAAVKVAQADYPIGFIIAPIFVFPGWRQEYEAMFASLSEKLSSSQRKQATFECITHRFTKRAKNQIVELFPNSLLPLDEAERSFKFGQFGYGKYVYPKETIESLREEWKLMINRYFPDAKIDYFI